MSNEKFDFGEDSKLKTCGCGRSPIGRCLGWHSLDKDDYLDKLDTLLSQLSDFRDFQGKQ